LRNRYHHPLKTSCDQPWQRDPLSRADGALPEPSPTPDDRCGDRTAMMPTRRRTRNQQRSQRITAERNLNRNNRLARRRDYTYARAASDDEPPPF
jgi:hypothetical protein